jgi:hypothetical protein
VHVRIVNAGQRLVLLDASGAGLDVEKASDGRFAGDLQAIFGRWDAFREWAAARDRDPQRRGNSWLAFMRCSTDHHNVLVQQAPLALLYHTSKRGR